MLYTYLKSLQLKCKNVWKAGKADYGQMVSKSRSTIKEEPVVVAVQYVGNPKSRILIVKALSR